MVGGLLPSSSAVKMEAVYIPVNSTQPIDYTKQQQKVPTYISSCNRLSWLRFLVIILSLQANFG
jgi:hypothetical protein